MKIKDKISEFITEVRATKGEKEKRLENALKERENILFSPIQRAQVKNDLALAVDMSARRFEKSLNGLVNARAVRRNAVGVQRTPEVIREQGRNNEINIDAINFFLGDVIKARTEKKIDEMDFFGIDDGLSEDEFKSQLNAIESKIDDLKLDRDEIVDELSAILK